MKKAKNAASSGAGGRGRSLTAEQRVAHVVKLHGNCGIVVHDGKVRWPSRTARSTAALAAHFN